MEVRKEFVLEAHKAACEGWKIKIEKEFPDFFKEVFKKGDWLINNDETRLVKYLKKSHTVSNTFDSSEIYGKQPSLTGWSANSGWAEGSFREATDKEIEKFLSEEALLRGFRVGVRFKSAVGACITNISREGFGYHFTKGVLYDNGGNQGIVYGDGRWGEILGEFYTKEEAEKKFNIKIV